RSFPRQREPIAADGAISSQAVGIGPRLRRDDDVDGSQHMPQPVLRLYEDILANAATVRLPALPRMIFVVHGTVTTGNGSLADGEAWHGETDVTLVAGAYGATCWRFELAPGGAAPGAAAGASASREKLSVPVTTLPAGDLLLRGDSVGFPPGGCAYRHRH